jgi:hypothetical protein
MEVVEEDLGQQVLAQPAGQVVAEEEEQVDHSLPMQAYPLFKHLVEVVEEPQTVVL